jgi:hypothetical protein
VLWGHRENAGTYQRRTGAKAAAGPAAKEETFAGMSKQPTPRSMAAAEEKLGELPQQTINAVRQAMAKARAADSVGDSSGCAGTAGEAVDKGSLFVPSKFLLAFINAFYLLGAGTAIAAAGECQSVQARCAIEVGGLCNPKTGRWCVGLYQHRACGGTMIGWLACLDRVRTTRP